MELKQIKLAITLDNGDLAIMSFLTVGRGNVLPPHAVWIGDDNSGWWRREPTELALFAEVMKTFPGVDLQGGQTPTAMTWRAIADSDIPQDRSYRGAWRDSGTAIDCDMVKAREIQRERLRLERKPLLEQLDVQYTIADELGDVNAKQSCAAEKQALRAVTADPRIESATTVEELKALSVEVMTGISAATLDTK